MLIPDEKYSPTMENKGAISIFSDNPELVPSWTSSEEIQGIQSIHDVIARSTQWNHELFVEHLKQQSLFRDLQNQQSGTSLVPA
jgi:hypothetical protein